MFRRKKDPISGPPVLNGQLGPDRAVYNIEGLKMHLGYFHGVGSDDIGVSSSNDRVHFHKKSVYGASWLIGIDVKVLDHWILPAVIEEAERQLRDQGFGEQSTIDGFQPYKNLRKEEPMTDKEQAKVASFERWLTLRPTGLVSNDELTAHAVGFNDGYAAGHRAVVYTWRQEATEQKERADRLLTELEGANRELNRRPASFAGWHKTLREDMVTDANEHVWYREKVDPPLPKDPGYYEDSLGDVWRLVPNDQIQFVGCHHNSSPHVAPRPGSLLTKRGPWRRIGGL